MEEKDMYLPDWVRKLGMVFLAAAAIFFVFGFLTSASCFAGAAGCLALGIAGILCAKNQWAKMVNDDEFIYSTMFGNEKKFRFSQIKGIKENKDSATLILENGKVHIEDCAVISERFANAISSALKNS